MPRNKIFILLLDGVGLRNFAYTDFYKIGLKNNNDITFWNNTPFDLANLGFNEKKIKNAKTHPLTNLYKNAQIQVELNCNIKKSKDKVYNSYRFPFEIKNFKSGIKLLLMYWIIFWNNSEKGLVRIRKKIAKHERKTKLYYDSLETLKTEKPAIVFCTTQRAMLAIAPILAAQDLGIPTAAFIFSWDNLPKATKIIETDYYFVWSKHMKKELQYYYPHILDDQIIITGTPQFEPHFDKNLLQTKSEFFEQYKLDANKKYICFSGDDITTSPYDPIFLEDTAIAIRQLNKNDHNLGIIFRRCPVDFSTRFDQVLAVNRDIITSIAPIWEKIGNEWNTIIPTKEDLALQINTIQHSELVINLGSSMVFDFVARNKPCGYFNYNVPNGDFPNWNVNNIYNYVHFRSMPNKDAVFWINSLAEISTILEEMISNNTKNVIKNTQQWFEIINQHPAQEASQRIWDAINKITA